MKYVETTLAVINCIGAPLCKYLGYHRKHHDYVRKFKSIRDELRCKMEDIELQLKAELLHPLGKIPKKGVQNWLEKAKAMIVEAQGIETKVCNGTFLCRARNWKLVEEKTGEMQTFLDKAPNASESLVIDGPSVGLPLPTSELVGAKAARDEIWRCLMEGDVSKIGVWGMGGVGKTTIVKHIHNDLLKARKFDKVIWVTISKEFNLIKLQDDIASALNLKKDLGEEGNIVRRAAILSERLKRAGKHVLILDDVWDEFSLEEVGIPEPSNSNGCKMVLTTRSKQVCNRTDCKDILVRPLSKEEALILFLSRVGPNTVENKTIMPLLELVVNECDGLPLTIFVIAGTLKGENDPIIWNNALKELKRRTWMVKEMEDKVIAHLKFSFDHLKDDEVKHCFLYCALYPEDSEIKKDELIECWIEEGFIDEMDTRKEMEDKGHAILKRLKDNCLLENAIDPFHQPCVKMHDALRDMALSITSMGPHYMIQAGMQLKKLPKNEEWKVDVEKVSLMENSISEILEDTSPLNCQLLTTLLLQRNPLKKIPNAFFANMPRLSVLNLSRTFIQSLPDSISELKNLTALLLCCCGQLRHVPCLSKLQRLKKLDLYWTAIEDVPEGMEMLLDLRYLDIKNTRLKDITAGLLSKLSRIQHLKLGKTKASAEELVTLENLEWFEGHFQEVHEFSKFVPAMQQSMKNLIRYALTVGPELSDWAMEDKRVTISQYRLCEGELIMLPFDVRELEIRVWEDLRSLTDDIPSLENATDLRVCRIMRCLDIECVVSLPCSTHPFQRLGRLHLYHLPKLREVIKVERLGSILPPSPTFSFLKVIHVMNCQSMKTLLPHWLLPNLQNLEQIYVEFCEQLIQVLGAPTSEDEENQSDALTKFSLPNLKWLRLLSLPELVSICSKRGVMVCDSLQLINVGDCSKLKRIPPFVPLVGNGQPYAYAPPSLQIESVNTKWWEWLEWDDPNFKNVLQSRFINFYDP